MICQNCGKVVLFEKIIDDEKRVYHLQCWTSEDGEIQKIADK